MANTYVKIHDVLYPASITGRMHDKDWDDRPSKAIRVEMSYADALALFVDDVDWSIIQETDEVNEVEEEVVDEKTGEVTIVTKLIPSVVAEEYNNSDYSVAGEITDHRDGTVTVKMGKLTAEELLAIIGEVL